MTEPQHAPPSAVTKTKSTTTGGARYADTSAKKISDPGRALSPLSRTLQRRVAPLALTEEAGTRATPSSRSSIQGVRERAGVATNTVSRAAAASRRERASAAAASAASRTSTSLRAPSSKTSSTVSTATNGVAPRKVNKAILLKEKAPTPRTSSTDQNLKQTSRAPETLVSPATAAAVGGRDTKAAVNDAMGETKDQTTTTSPSSSNNKEESAPNFSPTQAKDALIKALGLETHLHAAANTSGEDESKKTSATSTTTSGTTSSGSGSSGSSTNQTSNVTKSQAPPPKPVRTKSHLDQHEGSTKSSEPRGSTAEMQTHQQTTLRLMALRHAAKCKHTDGKCPTHANCREMKVLLQHMEQCHLVSGCLIPHCSSSRQFWDVIYPLSHRKATQQAVGVDFTAAAVAAVAANPKKSTSTIKSGVPSMITTFMFGHDKSNLPSGDSVASGLTGALYPGEQLLEDVERGNGDDPLRMQQPSWNFISNKTAMEQQALLGQAGRRDASQPPRAGGGIEAIVTSILKSGKSKDQSSTSGSSGRSNFHHHRWDAQHVREDVDVFPMKRRSPSDTYSRMLRCFCLFLAFLTLLLGLSMGLFYFLAAGEWDQLLVKLGWKDAANNPDGYTPVDTGDQGYDAQSPSPTAAPSALVLNLPEYTLEELQLGGPPPSNSTTGSGKNQSGVGMIDGDQMETPQMKAFRWIQSERRYIENLLAEKAVEMASGKPLSDILTDSEYNDVFVYTDIHWKHRFALATLYYSTTMTNSTNGRDGDVVIENSDWTNHRNWLAHGVPECQWSFVGCDRGESLWITNNNLRGTLPPELGLLTGMRDIAIMNHPLLSGSIPSELGLLDQTTSVNFASNAFTGTIPNLGNMDQVRWLYLNDNAITGPIPNSFAQMTQLAFLWLHGNQLSGPLPFNDDNEDWKYLQEIMLHSNSITGTIPDQIGTKLPRGRFIDLHGNELSGSIPTSISLMTDLEVLQLHKNNLDGSVPAEICEMLRRKQLLVLSVDCDKVSCNCGCTCGLDHNDKQLSPTTDSEPALNSSVPQVYATSVVEPSAQTAEVMLLLPNFTQDALLIEDSPQSLGLDWLMNDPQVGSYSIDRTLQRFSLATFYFSTNGDDWENNTGWLSYSEHECSWYSTSDDTCVESEEGGELLLESLMEWGNNLSGSIPAELGLLPALKWLFLGLNSLESSIPSELGLLSDSLQRLNLMRNQITGVLPTELGLLENLEKFDVSENVISGILVSELGQLSYLENLYLNNNAFKGQLPTELGGVNLIEGLNLGDNLFSGSIVTELGLMNKLKWLNLFGNEFTFDLPSEIGKLTNLLSLSVKDNALVGTIPSPLGQLSSSNSLTIDLRNNMLAGTVPLSLGGLTNLGQLLLDGNPDLGGSIPSELCNLASSFHLEVLTIDCNAVECPQDCVGKTGSACTCVVSP